MFGKVSIFFESIFVKEYKSCGSFTFKLTLSGLKCSVILSCVEIILLPFSPCLIAN